MICYSMSVVRNYQLFRYLLGCTRGAHHPVMNMYRNVVGLPKERAQTYWGIEGAAYPEALNIYGLHAVYADAEMMSDCFGRCPNRKRTKFEYGHSGLIHLEHHYTSMLDFAYMHLEAARYGTEKLQDQFEHSQKHLVV